MLLEIRRISREKEREMYENATESKAVCHCSMKNDTQNESEQGGKHSDEEGNCE